jgi:ketosteroid isomerase-like protein
VSVSPAELIERFYRSFQRRDAEGMAACYHKDVVFSDPVFQGLSGEHAKNMWRMLCARGKDLEVTFRDIATDEAGATGRAHWEATYSFTQTGRRVHNILDAKFRFRDGLIIDHTDSFSFWRWSRQALGPAGSALGWTPILRFAVRRKAQRGLAEFEASRGRELTGTVD